MGWWGLRHKKWLASSLRAFALSVTALELFAFSLDHLPRVVWMQAWALLLMLKVFVFGIFLSVAMYPMGEWGRPT